MIWFVYIKKNETIYIVLTILRPPLPCCFFVPERIFKHCDLTARGCLGSVKGLQKWKVQMICDRSCIPLFFLGWSERKVATSWSLKSFWRPKFLKRSFKKQLPRDKKNNKIFSQKEVLKWSKLYGKVGNAKKHGR